MEVNRVRWFYLCKSYISLTYPWKYPRVFFLYENSSSVKLERGGHRERNRRDKQHCKTETRHDDHVPFHSFISESQSQYLIEKYTPMRKHGKITLGTEISENQQQHELPWNFFLFHSSSLNRKISSRWRFIFSVSFMMMNFSSVNAPGWAHKTQHTHQSNCNLQSFNSKQKLKTSHIIESWKIYLSCEICLVWGNSDATDCVLLTFIFWWCWCYWIGIIKENWN